MPIETDIDGFSIMRMQCAIYKSYEYSWHVMQLGLRNICENTLMPFRDTIFTFLCVEVFPDQWIVICEISKLRFYLSMKKKKS